MGRWYYRFSVTVGVTSGTTASVPPQYREGSLRAELRAVPRAVLPLELFLPLFFFKRYFRSCTASVPLQYRKDAFRANFDRYLDRYFRFSSFCSFSPLSGTSGPVPVRYRFDTVGNFTQAVPGPVHGPVLRPQAVLPLGWAVLPPSIDLLYFLLSL